jgi:hypothetical protein
MTKIVVSELVTRLEQEFTYNKSVIKQLLYIRPYLYVHNNPSGTFNFDLLSGSTLILRRSFTAQDLYSALETTDLYAHLFYRLDFEIPLPPGTYKLRLSSPDYVYSTSSYIGWVHMHDDPINDFSYTTVVDNKLPLSFEAYEKGFNP